jgi:hypothetical protein
MSAGYLDVCPRHGIKHYASTIEGDSAMDMYERKNRHTEATEKLIEILAHYQDNGIEVEGQEDGSLVLKTPISDEISLCSVIRMK